MKKEWKAEGNDLKSKGSRELYTMKKKTMKIWRWQKLQIIKNLGEKKILSQEYNPGIILVDLGWL